jgi:adenylate cyclase
VPKYFSTILVSERRVSEPDAVVDFSILHDLKALGATDHLALPVASGHGASNYMITYVTPSMGPGSKAGPILLRML